MKKNWSTILLFIILFVGLSLLLYPSFANWWNSFHQSQVVTDYVEQIAEIDEDQYKELWDAAFAYNQSLLERPNSYLLSDEQQAKYNSLLDISGLGIMGYIEIPVIGVSLPIYHGTSEGVLQVAIGHLDWTSLPVGGESSHCVVSGHRGLPSAKLFTDLDQLEIGDTFLLYVLDEVLTYEVDQIRIVEPTDTQDLLIVEGEDLCTLTTCTPYGINTHRMLVRGHRIETAEVAKARRVTGDAIRVEPVVVAPLVAAPMLLLLLIGLMIPKRKKYRPEEPV